MKKLLIFVLALSFVSIAEAQPKNHFFGFFQKKQVSGSLVAKAVAHSVTLSCTPPTGSVTGYNFYKGTASGGENYSTPINGTTPTSACSYVDTAVVGLATYFYTAETVCATCSPSLSVPSNEAKAIIPGDPQPNPPGSLTVTSQ